MAATRPDIRIGIFGPDLGAGERHGSGLWPAGVSASITAAEGVPITLPDLEEAHWGEILEVIHGVVEPFEAVVGRIRAVTLADVRRVAAEVLGGPRVLGVVGPFDDDAVAAWHERP